MIFSAIVIGRFGVDGGTTRTSPRSYFAPNSNSPPASRIARVTSSYFDVNSVRMSPTGELWSERTRVAGDNVPVYDVFGTDGRLVMHNVPFARMWKLSESELDGQPHFAEIANLCTGRIGQDGIWGIVSCGVNSATPECFGEWSKTRRADGRVISLSLSRLPNGTTVVSFTDITDLEKFNALDASEAAA